jgi:hypothetical protein
MTNGGLVFLHPAGQRSSSTGRTQSRESVGPATQTDHVGRPPSSATRGAKSSPSGIRGPGSTSTPLIGCLLVPTCHWWRPGSRPVRVTATLFPVSYSTVFFSHNKSRNSTFSHDLSVKRTGQRPFLVTLTGQSLRCILMHAPYSLHDPITELYPVRLSYFSVMK